MLNKFDGSHLEDEIIQFYSLVWKKIKFFQYLRVTVWGRFSEKINEEALFSVNTKKKMVWRFSEELFLEEKVISKVAIVGSPNAGKSTLLNALVGEERALVSDIAGTTVDPIEAYFDIYFGKEVDEYDPLKFVAKHKVKKATIEEVVDDHLVEAMIMR